MSRGGDEVEHGMDAVVLEAGITLDAALLCQDIVILPFEVVEYFLEAVAAVDGLSEAGRAAMRIEFRMAFALREADAWILLYDCQ